MSRFEVEKRSLSQHKSLLNSMALVFTNLVNILAFVMLADEQMKPTMGGAAAASAISLVGFVLWLLLDSYLGSLLEIEVWHEDQLWHALSGQKHLTASTIEEAIFAATRPDIPDSSVWVVERRTSS